jgi:hypothetical protein
MRNGRYNQTPRPPRKNRKEQGARKCKFKQPSGNYLNAITPNKPSTLFPGPAVKKS